NKHWREERWAQLADALRERLCLCPVFMGARADLPMLERIRAAMHFPAVVAAGQTSLRQAAALMEGARAAVSVDTALMHIGIAVGTPVVALCGASYWPDFPDDEGLRMLGQALSCSPSLRYSACHLVGC